MGHRGRLHLLHPLREIHRRRGIHGAFFAVRLPFSEIITDLRNRTPPPLRNPSQVFENPYDSSRPAPACKKEHEKKCSTQKVTLALQPTMNSRNTVENALRGGSSSLFQDLFAFRARTPIMIPALSQPLVRSSRSSCAVCTGDRFRW